MLPNADAAVEKGDFLPLCAFRFATLFHSHTKQTSEVTGLREAWRLFAKFEDV